MQVVIFLAIFSCLIDAADRLKMLFDIHH